MKTLTMKDALEMVDQSYEQPFIYLYGEQEPGQEEIIFYVGKSIQPFERLQEHLGRGEDKRSLSYPDSVGDFILENLPASLSWFVRIIPLEEFRVEMNEERLRIDEVERTLIQKLRPCLNRTWNRHPTPRPAKYCKDEIANEGVILEK